MNLELIWGMMLKGKTVFLASRFDAFKELRTLLKQKITTYPHLNMSAINLDDGRVNHYPPLVECLAYVRRSSYMILIIGDEYGALAPDRKKSFTHLEYEEAVRDGAGTRVLVFFIGNRYRAGRIQFADPETPFGQWQREIERRHTIGFPDPDLPVEQIAKQILDDFLSAHYAMEFGQIQYESEDQHRDLFDAITNGKALDDSDVRMLDFRDTEPSDSSLLDDAPQCSDALAALLRPAAVAAYEQRVEAHQAIGLADYGCAIGHLQRALAHRPMDMMSNFWLALLYVNLGRKPDCEKAKELCERSARIALKAGLPYRAAASYMAAARAGQITGHPEEALLYAQQAVDTAPRYADARIELARNLIATGDLNKAMGEIEAAAKRFFPSLREIFIDPVFAPVRATTNALIETLRRELLNGAIGIVMTERKLATMMGEVSTGFLPEDSSRRRVIDVARTSASRQLEWVRDLVRQAKADVARLAVGDGTARSALDRELRELEDGIQTNATTLQTVKANYGRLNGWLGRINAYYRVVGASAGFLITLRLWLHGNWLPFLLVGLVSGWLLYLGYRCWRTYRSSLSTTLEKIGALNTQRARFADRQTLLKEQLVAWQQAAARSTERARESVRLFETGTLSQSNSQLFPFASLSSPSKADLVRVVASQLDWFRAQLGREIEEIHRLPEWLEVIDGEAHSGVRLFRFVRSESDKLILSRAGAYELI
ncbi:DUF4062 domain-containing protein [Robbsia andropogonis]|uniref:DUF4062 domain-containing protein n=1 Tax=Robbsia andropogonis TaxID=28092 RepID=UPI0020A0E4A1|nr:DUF4062 domain-containing protein [Robbsia andropogonis]MCP1131257.1 DUF4062 domain-containing protein [Robbsia andropogonis]